MSQVNTAVSSPSREELMAQIQALQAEQAKLKALMGSKLSMKISEKGALSVYGLGRFPITLYKSQWTRLLESQGDIKAFIQANEASLKVKGE